MNFAKMHGTGNDFVLLEPRGLERDWGRVARVLCDRHFGIGADGLLLVLPSKRADLCMRMFNPDGSEAEMCGNGLRCFAKYTVERGLAEPKDGAITVETAPGVLRAELFSANGRVERVRTSMGRPSFSPGSLPVLAEMDPVVGLDLEAAGQRLILTGVSMGNPHVVQFLDTPVADYPLERVGPAVEHHPLFPRRTNFEVARVMDRGHIEVRVWERGAGPTLACGSGACAVMATARRQGLVEDRVDITLPGGTLALEWDGEGEVFLTGAAEELFVGEWRGQLD